MAPVGSDSNYLLGNEELAMQKTHDVSSPHGPMKSLLSDNERQLLDPSLEEQKMNIISSHADNETSNLHAHQSSFATAPYQPYDAATIEQIVTDQKFETLKQLPAIPVEN